MLIHVVFIIIGIGFFVALSGRTKGGTNVINDQMGNMKMELNDNSGLALLFNF
jgi:hypothetical protein